MSRLDEIRARHARLTSPTGPVEFSDLDDVVDDVAYLLARVEALEAERARVVAQIRAEADANGSPVIRAAYREAADLVERGTP